MLKDGYASSTKYHGSLLRIKTPNTVIVFSNRNPRMRSLSKDHWKIYFITADGLTADHEEWMWEKQADNHTVAATKERKKTCLQISIVFYSVIAVLQIRTIACRFITCFCTLTFCTLCIHFTKHDID